MTQELAKTKGQVRQLENELASGSHEVATLREKLEQTERDTHEACSTSERLQDELGIVNQETTALAERLQQREDEVTQVVDQRFQEQETRLREFYNNVLQQMRQQFDTRMHQQPEQLTQQMTTLRNSVKPE